MIVSTTLAGPGAEHVIRDALRSAAPLVDQFAVLLSGCDVEKTVDALKAVGDEFGKPWVWRAYPWPSSYGKARTDALRWAEELGADWALTLDTDERLNIPPPRFERYRGLDALMVPDAVLCYQKPRYIRCGVGAVWVGPCSERLDVKGEKGIIEGEFTELQKTEEQERRRLERGIQHMPAMIEQDDHYHWRRHYAECLIGVGRIADGVEQHRRILDDPKAPEPAKAWAHYRIAEWEVVNEQYDVAFERCALGLARAPGFIQEFGWLLAHISCKKKNHTEAIAWASYALDAPLDMTRGGHRSPTWKACCEALLASARYVGAPTKEPPQPEYSSDYFASRANLREDYAALARALVTTLFFGSHRDLGAGQGLLVEALIAEHMDSTGVEKNMAAREHCAVPDRITWGFGLEAWGDPHWPQVDLVSCVEVLEHIPEAEADAAIDGIVARARRYVYLSAAQPGQGGHGHVNEQPPAYWASKMAARGWELDEPTTFELRKRLAESVKVAWWLPKNALIFKRSGAES